MIESIEREGTRVIININTGLAIQWKNIALNLETGKELFAELLKDRLHNQFKEFKKEIAQQVVKYPLLYLEREEVSKLKSMLVKEWDGSKHCWK